MKQNEQYDKIYKKSKTGKLLVWWYERDENKIRTVSGQVGGKMTTSEWKIIHGKNIGKINETSDSDQAHLNIDNHYRKQLDQGNFWLNPEDVSIERYFKPMLAQKYESWDRLVLGDEDKVFISPKLDGIRCIAKKDGLFTRNGKEIVSCPHILEKLSVFFNQFPEAILDGELYNHELSDDFNTIMSLVRKTKPTLLDILDCENHIQFHIYDYYSDKEYIERLKFLGINLTFDESIRLVPQKEVFSESDIREFDSVMLKNRYEGSMVRISAKCYPYEKFRSESLLKVKLRLDEEFIIHEIKEGVGNRSGMAGGIIYLNKNGEEFSSGIKGGYAHYKFIWENREKLIGTLATVEFMDYTPRGIPREPVTSKIHHTLKREF